MQRDASTIWDYTCMNEDKLRQSVNLGKPLSVPEIFFIISEKLLRFRAACLPEQQVRGHMIFLALMNPGVSAECWLKMVHSVLGMRFSGVRERQN